MMGSEFFVHSVRAVKMNGKACSQCGHSIEMYGIEVVQHKGHPLAFHSRISKEGKRCMEAWSDAHPQVFDLLFPQKTNRVLNEWREEYAT